MRRGTLLQQKGTGSLKRRALLQNYAMCKIYLHRTVNFSLIHFSSFGTTPSSSPQKRHLSVIHIFRGGLSLVGTGPPANSLTNNYGLDNAVFWLVMGSSIYFPGHEFYLTFPSSPSCSNSCILPWCASLISTAFSFSDSTVDLFRGTASHCSHYIS